MKVSIIIVNYNVRYFLEVCIDSIIRASKQLQVEIIVVDNDSKDDSLELLKERYPQVILIENKDNKGFSKANNQGVAIAKGEYILFLNPDTVMPEDFLEKTVGNLDAHPNAGALGPRIIDGKGQFSPDGKKSFPSFSVALFKSSGINKIFPKSRYFNKYYAVHIGDNETASVEVLSGCCMMVRRQVIQQIGGAFDEDYFMYCEDVDLSYRITQAGYQNIYFPEVTLIHYKGESTRKSTLKYIRIFNEALATFVRKHYSKGEVRLFLFAIQVGILLRAILGGIKSLFKILRLPLFDTLVLLVTLYLMKEFWVGSIKAAKPVPANFILATFPAYLFLWIISLWLNGAYDNPYRPLRVVRGMVIGSVMILAYYGLLDASLRYSRGLIMLSGVVGTVVLLALHETLYRLGILRFIAQDDEQRKAVIIGSEDAFEDAALLLSKVQHAPLLYGRISVKTERNSTALADLSALKPTLFSSGIGEVIFTMDSMSYTQVLQEMEHCGAAYDYKIHIGGSRGFVGSNSSHAAGNYYTTSQRYALSQFAQQRNKRVFDIVSATTLLSFFPIVAFFVKQPLGLLRNCFNVLLSKRTWIGYPSTLSVTRTLPKIKTSIVPCYNLQANYQASATIQEQAAIDYAKRYTPGVDAGFLWRNFRWLGQDERASETRSK